MNNNSNELVEERILSERLLELRQTNPNLYNETDHEHFIRILTMAEEEKKKSYEEEKQDPLADVNEVKKDLFYHIYNFIRYYIS
jgi:hypothetical protein